MDPMGRRRSTDHHLPARVYFSRGWHFYVDANGKWHKLGKAWDKAAKDEWVRLTTGKNPDGTVGELLDAFMLHCEDLVRAGKRSPMTHETNEGEIIKLKTVFGRSHYARITSRHCALYLRGRKDKNGKPAPIRANREIALLSSAYSWAMGEPKYDVTTNPCYGVRRNTEAPRERYVETWELRTFAKRYAPAWMRVYVLLKRLTALRQADMLRLSRQSLTDRGIELTTGKTGRRIIIRWSWALHTAVNAALKLTGEAPPLPGNAAELRRPLFPSRYGTQMTSKGFKTAWQRAMIVFAAAGFERFWEHDVRAKAASDASSLQRAQELLDHENPSTTQRYRRAPVRRLPAR